MNADLKGALQQLNKSWRCFEHNGQPMSKAEVKKVIEYGISKGYKSTADLSDEEIDKLLNDNKI